MVRDVLSPSLYQRYFAAFFGNPSEQLYIILSFVDRFLHYVYPCFDFCSVLSECGVL